MDHSFPDDEVARQRVKRRARMLAGVVSDDGDVRYADLMAEAIEATGSEEAADIGRWLEAQGHGWQTIETLQAYLTMGRHPVRGGSDA